MSKNFRIGFYFHAGKQAFTLIEVIISVGIFAMLMTAVIYTFKGGSDSFSSGNWRVQTQKKAQGFLLQLKENLEKANYAIQIQGYALVRKLKMA
ncbi:type II secretion system protein [bacterium]|nr:type II secretion system protein [bacterium]